MTLSSADDIHKKEKLTFAQIDVLFAFVSECM